MLSTKKRVPSQGGKKSHHQSPAHKNPKSQEKNDITTISLSYIRSVSELLGKVLRKHSIKTFFKPFTKISEVLPSPFI